MTGGKDFIIQVIERFTGITKEQMQHKTRKREIVVARHLAMYFFKLDDTIITLNSIGDYFGNRDHSTVIHAFQTVDDHYATDKHYKKLVDTICDEIGPKYAYLLGELSEDEVDNSKLKRFDKSIKNRKLYSTI